MIFKKKEIPVPEQPKPSIPEQPKIKLSQVDQITNLLSTYTGTSISQMLSNNISGIAKNTAQEIVSYAGIEDSKQNLEKEDINKLINALDVFNNIYDSKIYAPCVSIVNGSAHDFYATKYSTINEYNSY